MCVSEGFFPALLEQIQDREEANKREIRLEQNKVRYTTVESLYLKDGGRSLQNAMPSLQ